MASMASVLNKKPASRLHPPLNTHNSFGVDKEIESLPTGASRGIAYRCRPPADLQRQECCILAKSKKKKAHAETNHLNRATQACQAMVPQSTPSRTNGLQHAMAVSLQSFYEFL